MDRKIIMIVEDDRDLQLAMSVRLVAHGFVPLLANDAGSAIQLAALRAPDMILLDLGLPDNNGFVVMDIIKQLKSAADIPILVVSARPAEVYREPALLAGAKDYFQKPFDNNALMKAIQRELGEQPLMLESSNIDYALLVH